MMRAAGRVQMPASRWIPKILAKIITPEEARIVLELPLSIPEYAEKYKIDEAEAERILEEFANKGVCLPLPKDGVVNIAASAMSSRSMMLPFMGC